MLSGTTSSGEERRRRREWHPRAPMRQAKASMRPMLPPGRGRGLPGRTDRGDRRALRQDRAVSSAPWRAADHESTPATPTLAPCMTFLSTGQLRPWPSALVRQAVAPRRAAVPAVGARRGWDGPSSGTDVYGAFADGTASRRVLSRASPRCGAHATNRSVSHRAAFSTRVKSAVLAEAEADWPAFADGDRPRGFHVKRATNRRRHAIRCRLSASRRVSGVRRSTVATRVLAPASGQESPGPGPGSASAWAVSRTHGSRDRQGAAAVAELVSCRLQARPRRPGGQAGIARHSTSRRGGLSGTPRRSRIGDYYLDTIAGPTLQPVAPPVRIISCGGIVHASDFGSAAR